MCNTSEAERPCRGPRSSIRLTCCGMGKLGLPSADLCVTYERQTAAVRRGTGHPDQYLYVECDGRTYFLGVLEPGMTRGDVKRLALEWLKRRPGRRG